MLGDFAAATILPLRSEPVLAGLLLAGQQSPSALVLVATIGGFASGNSTYGFDLSAGGHDFYQIVGVDLRQNTTAAMTGHTAGANKKRKLNLGAGSNDDGQDVATAMNDNDIAGNIGEYMESVVLSGAAVALVTATGKTITSLTLTPGDWDIDGTVAIFRRYHSRAIRRTAFPERRLCL